MTNTEISSERLEEMLDEILDEDAPNKDVWKTHASQDEWLCEKILPVLRHLRRDRRAAGGGAAAPRPSYDQIIALVEECRIRRDEAGESSRMMSKWISEGLNALYLHPSNSRVAVKGLDQLEAIIHELAGEVAPGGPEDRAWAIINDLRSSLPPSPDTGKSQDQEGTWSDGGKEWTPDEVSFKAGWDKAKQLLKPEDLDGFDEAAARITELEKAVEQAFRDGLAYGSNVKNADPDIAWGHSRARNALGGK